MTVKLLENKDIQTINHDEILFHLYGLMNQFSKENDIEQEKKVKELMEKIEKNDFSIGFCGHFSAGKSSMMNKIMNAEVLPSSPIPTSANLVKVKKGRSYARVYYHEGEPVEFPAPYDYDVVKNYCKDGDSILSVEISDEDIHLPEGITILDTPGIDSTDDAHRIATESALHLADLIFYVMDYNHVQSEVNFLFTKSLKERGKRVYLIINQIDKHDDSELSFDAFQLSVRNAFKNWNVHPDGIFYTTLFQKDHPKNQYDELIAFINKQIEQKDDILLESVKRSAIQLINDHLTFVKKSNNAEIEKYETIINNLGEEKDKILNDIHNVETQLKVNDTKLIEFEDKFESEINQILDNAYMMPASTRELARSYIEACQDNFKVGLLFSKKKTEQEKEKRLLDLFEDLKKQVGANVDWHIKDFLVKFFKAFHINDEAFLSAIYEMNVDFTPNFISETVKSGALVTGDYVLNFASDLTAKIKRLYKDTARVELVKAKAMLADIVKTDKEDFKNKLTEFGQVYEALNEIRAYEGILNVKRDEMVNKFLAPLSDEEMNQALNWIKQNLNPKIEIKQQVMQLTKKPKEEQKDHKRKASASDDSKVDTINMQQEIKSTVDILEKSNELLVNIQGCKTIAEDLKKKANSLQSKKFTVALFGAFSAGKSSFANALMGERVLPVSPNPMTAAINKILAPTEEFPHGSVKVVLKSEEHLFKDLSESLNIFGKTSHSLEETINVINSISYDGQNAKEKPHYSFLQAVQKGYNYIKDKIGTSLIIGFDEFNDFVASEEKACFVEYIELYYDCEFTRQGMTLVDTPGADSINARHTGVAFEYIKNADAVLFVTYYNHAFSKADREFLIQLGRVKETFEMDKMFFIVNAADLAKSDEELNAVCDYVEDQLLHYGLRQTRIYPISSKQALHEKLENESVRKSGMDVFERDFSSFIMNDLVYMAIDSAKETVKYSVKFLQEMIDSANGSEEAKIAKKEKINQQKDAINAKINNIRTETDILSLNQEIDELIYYVKQRLFLRYNDLFNEAFNPASLSDDGRNLKKAIVECLQELLADIGFDLSQEMRATSLRIEKFINRLLRNSALQVTEERLVKELQIRFIPFDTKNFEVLEFKNELKELNTSTFASILGMFKNPKTFFENGGKVKMKDALQEKIEQPVDELLAAEKDRIGNYYRSILVAETDEVKANLLNELGEYVEGVLVALSDNFNIEAVNQTKKEIENLIDNKK